MFERAMKRSRVCALLVLMLALVTGGVAWGQDGKNGMVTISFLPPPLENATYSLGIYEVKSGRLVRHLQEIAPEKAFTVGLNGLITTWDGKDDGRQPVPPGKYAARGYAVGPMKIEGLEIRDNDWAKDDEKLRVCRLQDIALIPEDDGLAILASAPDGSEWIARYGGAKHELLWQRQAESVDIETKSFGQVFSLVVEGDCLLATAISPEPARGAYRLADGSEVSPAPMSKPSGHADTGSTGKDGTVWKIDDDVVCQYSSKGELLRTLKHNEGEPVPVAVLASMKTDRIYLWEKSNAPLVERVRGLSWKETAHEGDKAFSTWETFFERSVHLTLLTESAEKTLPNGVELILVENPLSPGKVTRLKLNAARDSKGSYLVTEDGLRLRQISQPQFHLGAVKLTKGRMANSLVFSQYDGAAWDEFSIKGTQNMMAFDAGEFELTAEGEKAHTEKPAEPPDL